MQNLSDDTTKAEEMQLVASMTAMWWARHHAVLKKQPLRYVDCLCDALVEAKISTPYPEVLAQLVPGMSQTCALELLDLKFHRFSSGSHIAHSGD